jgi:ubiquinone/menaquinone biosynthesis C-methylase UbiE
MPEGVLHPGGLQLTKRLVNACAFSRGAKVVDVGCGTGFTVEYLHNECGLCAAGVDISEICLQRGRARTAGLRLTRADGEALPFTSNSVQGVLTECSLSVMGDTGRVLAEINRILVPGGKLAITDLYFRTALSAGYTAQTGGVKTNDELVKMLRERGFSVNIWEDQSAYLKEFVARFIMEHGSAETLWQCLALRQKDKQLSQQMLKRGLGYFLLVAEKQPDR